MGKLTNGTPSYEASAALAVAAKGSPSTGKQQLTVTDDRTGKQIVIPYVPPPAALAAGGTGNAELGSCLRPPCSLPLRINNNSIPATAFNALKLPQVGTSSREEDEEQRGLRVFDPGFLVRIVPSELSSNRS